MKLELRKKEDCTFDMISLGEIMLRLDPGDARIRTARSFRVWEGGGEYNVARGLRKCFGLKTAAVTALADNEVGRLVEDFMLQGGVDTSLIKWVKYDGIGRTVRNGLNFTERGYGIRGALGVSDRGNTAASQLKEGDIDWEYIFGTLGVRWLHTGGIFAALSDTTAKVVIEAVKTAKKYGTVVSYDLNYRPSLWNDENLKKLNIDGYKKMMAKAAELYPNFKVAASTLRTVKTATVNDWSAICWADGKVYNGLDLNGLEIYDRVGGGDSFASGLIYGLMETGDPQTAVNYGVAHGALAMTTPGDTSMATKAEVERIIGGVGARVQR